MDGFHDLGGRQGFGPVDKDNRDPFHDDWEVRVTALMGRLAGQRVMNMDEYRHAVERMEPRHYVQASYFERTFTALATLCVEKGLITHAELNAAAGRPIPLSRPSAPGRVQDGGLPDLKIGDRVQVKQEFVPGHIRMPGYIRGRQGVVVGISPEYHYADAAGHGLDSPPQRTFDVRFRSSDLWADGAEAAEVHVGVFHAYLTKLP